MTNFELEDRLAVLKNLSEETAKFGAELVKSVDEKDRKTVLTAVQQYVTGMAKWQEDTAAKSVLMRYLCTDILEEREGSCKYGPPKIRVTWGPHLRRISVSVPCNGGALQAYATNMNEEAGVGTCWQENVEISPQIDLAYAEVKSDDLAKVENNKQVDLYIWEEPESDEWTEKVTYPYSELQQIIEEE